MSLFSGDEERRVSDAITQAERKTSGEIVVVVAARSDTYLYVHVPGVGELTALGTEPKGTSSDDFGKFIVAEQAKWKQTIEKAGIKPQ